SHAVALMRETVGDRLGVRGSGGIRTGVAAEEMIAAGASPLGLSGSEGILEALGDAAFPPASRGLHWQARHSLSAPFHLRFSVAPGAARMWNVQRLPTCAAP